MKWPKKVVLIRHGQSAYNDLKRQKQESDLYLRFKEEFNTDPESKKTRTLAKQVEKQFKLNVSDRDTPLTNTGEEQAVKTGVGLSKTLEIPDVILCSPYLRTKQTLLGIQEGWPTLTDTKVVFEERIREQDHGMSLLYNDALVFQALHRKDGRLMKLLGYYDYRFPNGENKPDVNMRMQSILTTLVREYSDKEVWMIMHHIGILSFMTVKDRLSHEEFLELDTNNKPVNCGVTIYEGKPERGKDGHLVLKEYNTKHY